MRLPARIPPAAVYGAAEPDMLLSVIGGSRGPGVIPFSVARGTSQTAEALLSQRVDGLAANLGEDEADIAALEAALAAETKALQDADTMLGRRVDAFSAAMVPFTATLTLTASMTLLSGKTTRNVSVPGLKKNDNLVVTPNAALPATVSACEAYCLTDGILSIVLINSSALLTISAAQTIPLGIVALRPTI